MADTAPPDFDPVPLAAYGGAVPPAPDWFTDAVNTPYETCFVEVQGARVHYQLWGDAAKPGLLFVHGNGAHAHWWDFIAPFFIEHYHVAAMTFSGMGDSDRRAQYSMDLFAAEEMAVLEDAGMLAHETPPIICAHSFGGFVNLLVAAEHGDRLGGTVTVDTRINPPGGPEFGPPTRPMGTRVYPTLEAALARFRLAPPQPCENHYILDFIARHSLKQTMGDQGEAGWGWKFDPGIWRHYEGHENPGELMAACKCRTVVIRGEQSILAGNDVRDFMLQCLGPVPFISIPHAQHHVMLDQPLAFVAALRTLLAGWRSADSRA